MSVAVLREPAAGEAAGGRGAAGPRPPFAGLVDVICRRGRVPVVGLPLDANRCARWLGGFLPNTVSLGRLEPLVVAG